VEKNMSRNFKEIMGELSSLLKQGMDDPELTGGGPDVVNKEKGEIGSSTTSIPDEAKGDVSLRLPHKDGDTLTYDKENAYPDRLRSPNGSTKEMPLSRIGDKDMGLEDAPSEKKAAVRAHRLLNSIDQLLAEGMQKQASHQTQEVYDSLALQKAASFEAGRAAAKQWASYITKVAEEDGPLENSKEHRGDLADTAVSRLIPRSDPHEVSDGKSPESEPSSSGDKKAPKLTQGNVHVDDTLESKAEVAIIKAQLYDELFKAAAAQDDAAMAMAKARIFDFLNGEL
jgi:hypothetical protein